MIKLIHNKGDDKYEEKQKMGGGSFKYLIPGIIAVILLSGVLLSNKFITKQNLGSIYNIDEAGDNFDNIQIGDEINYEINGYSDWQVIGKDDYEGTIDVVSKTNTEDLTLEPDHDKEYYESIFQETANKYTDNNYVISTRTVNNKDLEYFVYDELFWINDVDEKRIKTSIVAANRDYWDYKRYKLYIFPLIKIIDENSQNYSEGDTYNYENNGINEWVVESVENGYLNLLPKTPIEIVIDDINTNITSQEEIILNSFRQSDVVDVRKYIENTDSANKLVNLLSDFFNIQTEKIWLDSKYTYFYNRTDYIEATGYALFYYEDGKIGTTYGPFWSGNKSIGYRPVIKLKISNKRQQKQIDSGLKVGDYVSYSVNGYNNWKVLSIDKDNNTVDIISGGIVKNITLSGKEDYDNLESIIQVEVDSYKNGNNAISATSLKQEDINLVQSIDNSILPKYWISSKTYYKAEKYSGPAYCMDYSIGTFYTNKYNNYETMIDWIAMYRVVEGDEDFKNHYIRAAGSYSYTAGLRPVITLKLDSIEKLPEEETKKIEESTEKQEKIYIKEQESKNKDYKGPSKVDDSTSSTGNNNEVNSNDKDNAKDNITDNNTSKVEKIVYKDKPFYKYGFYILLVICLIETLMLIIPKINKK